MEKIRVCLVDDHPVVREGIRRLLERDERILVVAEAANAEEALAQVEETSPRVVLMDVRMPGVDGIVASRRLTDKEPGLRVVILSSFGDQYVTSAIEAGACGYVLKSATGPELVKAVVQAADGQSPIDSKLASRLVGRLAEMAKTGHPHSLSHRQQDILRLISDGVASEDIAKNTSISHATLTRELRRIYDVLGVDSRAHAVAEAHKRELL